MLVMMIHPIPSISAALLVAYVAMSTSVVFDFGNGGSVNEDNPLQFQPQPYHNAMTLVDPQFLGAGGGGAVFSYSIQDRWGATTVGRGVERRMGGGDSNIIISDDGSSRTNDINNKVVVKYSWIKSAESVRNECDVLRVMEQREIQGVERCLGVMNYGDDPRRVVIALQPLMEDAVSSLGDMPSDAAASRAVSSLMKTMAQMLFEGIVTTDVQPLFSKTTGEVILIDMTEAVILAGDPLTDIERALISEFCTEMINLIPERLLEIAAESFTTEMMDRIDRAGSYPLLSNGLPHRGTLVDNDAVKEVLKSLPITTKALLDYYLEK
jgi:hypothetical protein